MTGPNNITTAQLADRIADLILDSIKNKIGMPDKNLRNYYKMIEYINDIAMCYKKGLIPQNVLAKAETLLKDLEAGNV